MSFEFVCLIPSRLKSHRQKIASAPFRNTVQYLKEDFTANRIQRGPLLRTTRSSTEVKDVNGEGGSITGGHDSKTAGEVTKNEEADSANPEDARSANAEVEVGEADSEDVGSEAAGADDTNEKVNALT